MKPLKKNAKRKRKHVSSSSSAAAAAAAAAPPESMVETLSKEEELKSDEKRAIDWLNDAFSGVSLEEVTSAYREAAGDAFKAAGILGAHLVDPGEGSVEEMAKKKAVSGRKPRRVVAASGNVLNVIGKGYSKHVGVHRDGRKGFAEKKLYNVGEAEEFLCSMLGGSNQLGMAVVKDVLGQCAFDVEKALDVLLNISASSNNQFREGFSSSTQLTDKTSDSTYHPSGKEYQYLPSVEYICGDYTSPLTCPGEQPLSRFGEKPDLQQKVLESLFNIPENPKYVPKCVNWKEVVKKVESFGHGLEFRDANTTNLLPQSRNGNSDGYQVFRSPAQVHYDTMKTCYQKAATAYASGQRSHAAYLSEQGKYFNKLGHEADEKASREIFGARNKSIKNAVTIDLHGQHVKGALGLLKLHLLLFAYIPSIPFLKVITGCGADGVRMGKIKRSVIRLMEREGIKWREENSGTLVLHIEGLKEYKFLESGSNSE